MRVDRTLKTCSGEPTDWCQFFHFFQNFAFFLRFCNFDRPNGPPRQPVLNVFESLSSNSPKTVDGFHLALKMRPQRTIENDWSDPFFSIFHGFMLFQAPRWVLTAKIGIYFLKFMF